MANFSGFNKFMKLPKLVLISSFHSYLQPISSTIVVLSNKYSQLHAPSSSNSSQTAPKTTQSVSAPLPFSHHQNHTQYRIEPYRSYSSNRTPPSQTPSANTNPTIDEFRAREERREKEYSEQTEEAPPDEQDQKKAKADAVRIQILEAGLQHVAEHGWTRKAITQGAEDAGYPGIAHGMFPDGAIELVAHFYAKCNEELVEQLKAETNNGQKSADDPLDFLVRAVKSRLQMTLPYKTHWPQALAVMALPQNVPKSLAQILILVDDICYYSGDRSVDFGWYTRRVGLATIYKMVELYMLQDSSPDNQETWLFLKNRMEDAGQLQLMLSQTEGLTNNFPRAFNSAFVTARNILGLGYNRR